MLDLKNLEIGKVYPTLKQQGYKENFLYNKEKVCFIKINEKLSDGYLVDIEFEKKLVARNQKMILNEFGLLESTGEYGGTLYPQAYLMVQMSYLGGHIKKEDLVPTIFKTDSIVNLIYD